MSKKITKLSQHLEKEKEKRILKMFKTSLKETAKINIIDVIKKFIMDKGLKIYGGMALNEYFKVVKDPIYKKTEFPDFDVYSPDAWKHAKEFSNILYKLGFYYVEARSSLLNTDSHKDYKVSIDMNYILDFKQFGCTEKELSEKNCKNCGYSKKDKKCIDLFNNMPCYDVTTLKNKNKKVYEETYDFKTNKGLHPNKLFIIENKFAKIDLLREMTEPYSNPSRILKIKSRLEKLNKYYEHDHTKCTKQEYNKLVKEEYKPILDHIGAFVKEQKLVNYGASAYNFFIKNNKHKFGTLAISDYEVYTDNQPEKYYNKLLNELTKKFKNYKFNLQENITYWKEYYLENYSINVKLNKKGGQYNKLITFTKPKTCISYVQYNGVRYASVDRIKYLYYKAISLPKIVQKLDNNPLNYECLLSNILKLEKEHNKKKKVFGKGKFRKLSRTCIGFDKHILKKNLLKRFDNKIELSKKTKYKKNSPKKGFITKSYPIRKELDLPYMPAEKKVRGINLH